MQRFQILDDIGVAGGEVWEKWIEKHLGSNGLENLKKALHDQESFAKLAHNLIDRMEMPSAPAERGEAAIEEGWVVQVGSFSEEGRAQTLHKRLREKGFEAFVEPFTSGEMRVYRVKVGPPAARADAEGLAVRLEQELGLKGLVVLQP